MSNKDFVRSITIVSFRAWDNDHEEHYFDMTVKQATNFIFKHVCATALIKSVHVYQIAEDGIANVKLFDKKAPVELQIGKD